MNANLDNKILILTSPVYRTKKEILSEGCSWIASPYKLSSDEEKLSLEGKCKNPSKNTSIWNKYNHKDDLY